MHECAPARAGDSPPACTTAARACSPYLPPSHSGCVQRVEYHVLSTWEYTWILGVRNDAPCGNRSSFFLLECRDGLHGDRSDPHCVTSCGAAGLSQRRHEATHMANSACEAVVTAHTGMEATYMTYPACEAVVNGPHGVQSDAHGVFGV